MNSIFSERKKLMNKIKYFYVFDFFKNFFKWHNIPMMIYLIMNLLFIFMGTVIFVSSGITAYYDENPAAMPIDVASKEFYLITAAIITTLSGGRAVVERAEEMEPIPNAKTLDATKLRAVKATFPMDTG